MVIVVTGHRPDKLGDAYDVHHPTNIAIAKRMRKFIMEHAGYDPSKKSFEVQEVVKLISGMAIGIDTLWALVALKLREEFPDKFQLECAIPCAKQDRYWRREDKERYRNILSKADIVTYVSKQEYKRHLAQMQKRNIYMVDQAVGAQDTVFAVWNGSAGGTGNCVQYAIEQHRKIYVLHPFELTGGFIDN